VNAGCAAQDIQHFKNKMAEYKDLDVRMEIMSQHSLLALQGPKAAAVLQRYIKDFDLSNMAFMTSRLLNVDGVGQCRVTRCGYTGEDGFEISVPSDKVEQLATRFAQEQEVKLAGLGPRDTLRLEAGLCLMGHDMNSEITPIEAGLAWTVGKRRREEGNFPGAATILKQLKDGVDKLRVGFTIEGKTAAREGYVVYDETGSKELGKVTSGSLAPSLENTTIGMAYVPTAYSKAGTPVVIDIRGKKVPAKIADMPFHPHNYFRGKKQ
jgi:aminomethyltransferase